MKPTLRLLIITESAGEADLVADRLRQAGYEIQAERVAKASQILTALETQTWDLVVADYHLSRFNALAVLTLLRETGQDIPFIVVAAGLDEAEAVTLMQAGVHDYVPKESLAHLVSAAVRELRQAQLRREYRHVAQALIESEQKFRLFVESMFDVIWVLDLETMRFSYVSPQVEQLRGYTVEEVLAQDASAALTPASQQHLQQVLPSRVAELRQGLTRVYRDEIEQPCKDGTTIWTETHTLFRLNPQNKRLEVYGVSRDITARKRTEAALQENEARFRQMFENHNAVMLLVDPDSGTILDANTAARNYYGYPLATLQHMAIQDINTLRPEEIARHYRQAAGENRNFFVFPHRLASGEMRIVEVHSSPIQTNGKVILFSIIHDITERKQVEIQLAQQLEELSRWHTATLGREMRVLELKREVNDLLRLAGQPQRYPSAEAENQG